MWNKISIIPEDESRVLIYYLGRFESVTFFEDLPSVFVTDDEDYVSLCDVEYWMYIPELPEE